MYLGLRNAYLIAAVALLLVLPLGPFSVMLVLFVAVALAAAAMMLRAEPAAPQDSVVPLGGDAATLALLRRTVPDLRMRRPFGTVEAQVRWRQTAQSHRRRREIFS